MNTRNIYVVTNPVGATDQAEELRDLLSDLDASVEWLETTENDPGIGQTRRAVQQGADMVLACGGDGTVRACAEGLVGSEVALGVIPAGTGNLLARNLSVPTDVAGALRTALSGSPIKMDVGTVNGEVFTVLAGAGLDASIMTHTSRRAKEAVGALAYVATATREVAEASPTRLVVEMEDDRFEMEATTILVGNCGKLQLGVDLLPGAEFDDGLLDILILTADGLTDWLKTAVATVKGSTNGELMVRRTTRHLVAEFADPLPYELDGEGRPHVRRLEFDLRPKSLTVMRPEVPE